MTGLWLLCTGLSGCTVAIRPVPQDATGAAVTAFVDVAVIPMDRERVLMDQTVLVQGGHITALGSVEGIQVPPTALRIDGRGKFLIPGLADMHTHLADRATMPDDTTSAAAAIDSTTEERRLLLLVAHGVTTVRNMDFSPSNVRNEARILRFRARAAAGMLLSPRIYTSGAWGPRQYVGWAGPNDPPPVLDSVATYVAAYKAAGYDHLKIHDEYNLAIVDSVAAAAHRIGIPVVGHLPGKGQNRGAYNYQYALSVGYKSIEHLNGYGKEDVGIPAGIIDSAIIDTMSLPALTTAAVATKRAGVWNCPTQLVIESAWLSLHDPTAEVEERQFGGGLPLRRRLVQALQAAGAGLLLGTDAIGSVQDELAALVRAGLTPYQALATGTRNVAVYYGTLAESGTVTVGKRADLVLLDGNPLVDIQNATQIAGVMLRGRWLSRTDLDHRVAASSLAGARR